MIASAGEMSRGEACSSVKATDVVAKARVFLGGAMGKRHGVICAVVI